MKKPHTSTPRPDSTTASAPRRNPTQRRSRERLERIHAVASQLIAERGSDQMKMSEVAERAEISIGSLYQYFPDKSAIIRSLAETYHTENRACIEKALSGVKTRDQLRDAYCGLIDEYYEMFLAEPVMRDIWAGTQADKHLAARELEESRVCGAMLEAAMRRVHPQADAKRIATIAFMVWQLGEAAMRLAISVGRAEGDAIVDAYKEMTLREITEPDAA